MSKIILLRWLFSLALFVSFLLQLANWLNLLANSLHWRKSAVLHRHGQFCVLFDFTRANSPVLPAITLAVHSSLHFAHKLHVQAQHWDGPISAAILVRPGEEPALVNLLALWHCSWGMREKVSLHLVWRMAPFQQECPQFLIEPLPSSAFSCQANIDNKGVLPIVDSIGWSPLRYPINTLRNVARLGASPQSRVHIVADVENLFSANFTAMVGKFARGMADGRKEAKELFVFRRYEVEEGQLVPMSITLDWLAEQVQRGVAFPFHRHFFPVAHWIPGLGQWLNHSLHNKTVLSHPLSFRNAAFEPQFLMPANAPLHFEHVPARLFDHQVLLLELCRSGYRLRLLSHVFNVHVGVRRGLSPEELLVKRIGAKEAWKLRETFRQCLDRKYGQEKDGNCPNFWNRLNLARRNAFNN